MIKKGLRQRAIFSGIDVDIFLLTDIFLCDVDERLYRTHSVLYTINHNFCTHQPKVYILKIFQTGRCMCVIIRGLTINFMG